MNKWFEVTGKPQGIIVSSRVRLARNIDGFVFPEKLDAGERRKLIDTLRLGLSDLDMN